MTKHFDVGPRMSQAVARGGFIHIAGQVPDDRSTSVEDQTKQVLAKIDALLDQAGGSKSGLLSVNVFLAAIGDFDRIALQGLVAGAVPHIEAVVVSRTDDRETVEIAVHRY